MKTNFIEVDWWWSTCVDVIACSSTRYKEYGKTADALCICNLDQEQLLFQSLFQETSRLSFLTLILTSLR